MAFVGTLNAPNDFGFKNRLINGALAIWQRGTSLTGTGAASAQYLADRWGAGTLTSAYVMSRNTDVPSGQGFPYSLKIQRSAGQTSTAQANVIQVIESNNMYGLAGQTITLSFWAKCGANYSFGGSALGVIVQTGTVADQSLYNSQGAWTGASYPVNGAVTLTTSWQKFTYTATVSSSALGMCVYFYMAGVGTAGADDSFYIAGIQLEEGSTATSFDFRPYTTELQLCQRYYWRFGSTSSEWRPMNFIDGTSLYRASWDYPVTMRTTPVLTTGGFAYRVSTGSLTNGSVSSSSPQVGMLSMSLSCPSAPNTYGHGSLINLTDSLWAVSAEL